MDQNDDLVTIQFDEIEVTLQTAEDEFNADKKTLFATYIWNGGKVLTEYLIRHREIVADKSVVELGAAAGLPSIVAAKLGASFVCATDYPSSSVLKSLQFNMNQNEVRNSCVLPHIWGESVEAIVASNNGAQFNVILASECLWRHECHLSLLQSAKSLLIPSTGKLILAYSHHVPGLEREDDEFFNIAASVGFRIDQREAFAAPHMWNEAKIVQIYLVILSIPLASSC